MTSIILFALGIAFMAAIPAYIVANLLIQHSSTRA